MTRGRVLLSRRVPLRDNLTLHQGMEEMTGSIIIKPSKVSIEKGNLTTSWSKAEKRCRDGLKLPRLHA